MLYNNITETIGGTPLVMLNGVIGNGQKVALKLESFNPLSSVKDRIGLNMIKAAEEDGTIKPGTVIV